MASLVDQIFMQADAGSANGQSMIAPMIAGAQLAQSKQRINLEQQQLAAELAQLPLKQTLLQQNSTLRALEIQDALQGRQNYLDSTKAFTNLVEQVSPLLAEGKIEDAQRLTTLGGLSNNFLLTDPRYKVLTGQLDAMRKEADMAQYRLSLADASLARAEAAQTRAELAGAQHQLSTQRLELDKRRENRLQEQFEDKVARYERAVPPDKLALFRERAALVRNDLSLLTQPEKAEEKLKAIAEELGIGRSTPAASLPAPPAAPEQKRFTLDPKTGRLVPR